MRSGVFSIALLLLGSGTASGATIVVDPSGAGDYREIQAAIDAAEDGDEVLLKPGEYVVTEPIEFRGKAVRVRGEAGARETTIRMAKQPADRGRASVVIFEAGETEATALEGVTLTGGKGTLLPGNVFTGGGVYCYSSSPTLEDCRISGNSADVGGGAYCYNSSTILKNCTISENSAGSGCGVFSGGSSPTLTNCTISKNSAWDAPGGAVSCWGSSPILRNCTISENPGGGVYCDESSSPALTNCTISGNRGVHGGGLRCRNSSPALTNCTISGNRAEEGGGLYLKELSSPALTNCTISGNSADWGGGVFSWGSSPTLTSCTISENSAQDCGGGGAYGYGSAPTFTNCTISGNTARYGGGVYSYYKASPILANCIVWHNAGGSIERGDLSEPRVTFSCIEGEELWPGEGNIRADPLFCGWPSGEVSVSDQEGLREALKGFSLALSEASPCRGSGAGGSDMGSLPVGCAGPGPSSRSVRLAAGTYEVSGLPLCYDVSLLGAGEAETFLRGTLRGLRTGALLSDLTVTGGDAGGIVVSAGESPEITNCTISGNRTGEGGGGLHCCYGSSPLLTNCTISGNWAWSDGGGVSCGESSSPTLTNCVISGNWAEENGGGLSCLASSPTLTNCTISGNSARYGGGVCSSYKASPILANCIVWHNAGGSIERGDLSEPRVTFSCIEGEELWPGEGNIRADPLFCGWPSGEVSVSDQEGLREALKGFSLALSEASPCRGSGAGGSDMGSLPVGCAGPGPSSRSVRLAAGTYEVSRLILCHKVSLVGSGEAETLLRGTLFGLRTGALLSDLTVTEGDEGGVVISRGESPEITNCRISGNWAWNGIAGGVSCWGSSPTFTNCTISENSGGVTCWGSSPTLTNCTISSNWADSGGGVCCWDSSPILTSCTISSNSGDSGGGVSCWDSSPTLTSCTISSNSAGCGGGVFCCGSAPTLTNCTISGNSARDGGGVSCLASSPTLTNCTISGNSARYGGGVCSSYKASPILANCIVWHNAGGSIERGDLSEPRVTFSCIEGEELWPGEGNIRADPLFAALGRWDDRGTPEVRSDDTWVEGDYHLRAGSPCIDAGTCEGAPETDIEGVARPQGGGCDMGAYEFSGGPFLPRFRRGDTDADGKIHLTDGVYTCDYLFRGCCPEPPCLEAADANDDGGVNIADPIYLLNWLFRGGPWPPPPGPYRCGRDPPGSPDLGCRSYPPCE